MLTRSTYFWMSAMRTTSRWEARRIWMVECPKCETAKPSGHSGPSLQSKQKWFFSFFPDVCWLQCEKKFSIVSKGGSHAGPSLLMNLPPITIVQFPQCATPKPKPTPPKHSQFTHKTHPQRTQHHNSYALLCSGSHACAPALQCAGKRSFPHRVSPHSQIILHAYTSVTRKSLNVASLLPNSAPQRFLTDGIPHFRRASLKNGLGALFRV